MADINVWGEEIKNSNSFLSLNSIILTVLTGIIYVSYWLPTQPSCQNKKCTSVNNWCIRSKIGDQGMALTVVGLNWVGVKQWYNPGDRKFRWVREKMLECPRRDWTPRPLVEQPRRTGKKGCDSQKSLGVNMLQFCSVSNSLSHTTLSIKWEVYFSKELYPLVFTVSSLWFCMHLHMSIQHIQVLRCSLIYIKYFV